MKAASISIRSIRKNGLCAVTGFFVQAIPHNPKISFQWMTLSRGTTPLFLAKYIDIRQYNKGIQ